MDFSRDHFIKNETLMTSLKKIALVGAISFAVSGLASMAIFALGDKIQNDHLEQVNALTDRSIELYKKVTEEGNKDAAHELQEMAKTNFFGAVIFTARLESKAGNIQVRDQYIRNFVKTGSDLDLYLVLKQFDFVFDDAGAAEYIRRAYDTNGRYNAEAMKELETSFVLQEREALKGCYDSLSARFKSLEDDQIDRWELWRSIAHQRFGWPKGSCTLPPTQDAA